MPFRELMEQENLGVLAPRKMAANLSFHDVRNRVRYVNARFGPRWRSASTSAPRWLPSGDRLCTASASGRSFSWIRAAYKVVSFTLIVCLHKLCCVQNILALARGSSHHTLAAVYLPCTVLSCRTEPASLAHPQLCPAGKPGSVGGCVPGHSLARTSRH